MRLIWKWSEFGFTRIIIWIKIGDKYHQFYFRLKFKFWHSRYKESNIPSIINIVD